MKLKTVAFASITCLLPLAAISFATAQDGPPRRGAPALEKFDANGDGQISRDEADAANGDRFSEADTNGDGALSLEEMAAHREQQRAERRLERQKRGFDRLDQNGDGEISPDEFSSPAARLFERADLDENGIVTETELATLRDLRRTRRGRRGPGGRRGRNIEQGRGS